MAGELQTVSMSSTETNTENSSSQCGDSECVTNSGMVVKEKHSEEPNNVEERNKDASSTSSKDNNDQDECQIEVVQETDSPEECAGNFGNIVVKNSSEVQFGNKVIHQYDGPVTVKKFVHGSENHGQVNSEFQSENVTRANGETESVVTENTKNNVGFCKGSNWLNYIYKRRKLLAICVAIVVIILVILLIVFLVNKPNDDTSLAWRKESNLSGKLKIIQRYEWLAETPKDKLSPLTLPVQNVIIAHTVSANCKTRGKCTDIVRYTQHYHVKNRGWSDIGYNFLVGGDGFVYEGRGWENVGAHTLKWNSKSIGIAFIGTFDDILPPTHQILAAQMLIEEGAKKNYLAEDYNLYAHLQVSSFRSPGEIFYENIQTWPHWTNRTYKNT